MQLFTIMATAIAVLQLSASCTQSNGAGVQNSGDKQPQGSSSDLIQWTVKSGNSYFSKNSDEIYVYLSVKSGQPPSVTKRVPLNISLVLDRSGSMRGEKIGYAKKAAKFVVDQLSSDDYLSIVNYDDIIEVSSPAQQVKNKEALKMTIDKLFDRGSTNLSGGLIEGYAQVKKTMKDGYVNRVLILTDGLANQGIVNPDKLKELAFKKYSDEGIALSTFGLGADYDEQLLTSLAETGHANYYFIDSADKIPALFANELKGLLSVVAQNASADVSIPEGLICEKVYGYPWEVKNNKVIIKFNDIYSNDEKTILIKFRPKKNILTDLTFNCRFNYTDAMNFTPVSADDVISVRRTDDEALVKKNEDKTVSEFLALFEATDDFDHILVMVDAENYSGAKDAGTRAIIKLKQKQLQFKSPKIQKQLEDMEGYVNSIDTVKQMKEEEKKLYQKSNKAINYKSIKGRR